MCEALTTGVGAPKGNRNAVKTEEETFGSYKWSYGAKRDLPCGSEDDRTEILSELRRITGLIGNLRYRKGPAAIIQKAESLRTHLNDRPTTAAAGGLGPYTRRRRVVADAAIVIDSASEPRCCPDGKKGRKKGNKKQLAT